MALSKGVNSYATLAEANAYFGNRLDVAAWDGASDTQKEQALMTATAYIDSLNWLGYIEDSLQLLAFPRICEYFDPRLGRVVAIDSNAVPNRIIIACYEIAYHFLNNDGILDETGSVIDLSAGPIKLTQIKNAPKIPSHVARTIAPLLVTRGSTSWWRAN